MFGFYAGLELGLLAFALWLLLAASGYAQDVRSFIPPRAYAFLPLLKKEVAQSWPASPSQPYFGALIEHESCISLKHSRCWSPTSQLKSEREEGAGLGQITRAYKADGSLRFDALAEMRSASPSLADLSWQTIYQRPDLQMRAIVLKVAGDYRAIAQQAEPMQRLAFADAAYNGGRGGVDRERRACALKTGCDAQQWAGHVEQICLKSRKPLYGGRSACDINRHHVADVIHTRLPKYAKAWGAL